MPWSATDTIPSLKNKSLAVRALFARVANEALKTRSEEEAVYAGLAAVSAEERKKQKEVKKQYAETSRVPKHLQAILDLANNQKQDEVRFEDKPKFNPGLLQKALDPNVERNLISAKFNAKGQLVLEFDTGEQLATDPIAIKEFIEQNVVIATELPEQYDHIQFNLDTPSTNAVGRLRWNNTDGTLDLGLGGGNVTLQVGQEEVMHIYNNTAVDFTDLQVLRITGSQGQRLTASLAQANSEITSSTTFAVVTEPILKNQQGFATVSGLVREVNTSAFPEGAALYLSPTVAGGLTHVKPTAPNHMVLIGWCVRSHSVNGSIYVTVQNGYELDELHNVLITSPINGHVLRYDGATNLWKNASPAAASGVTTASYFAAINTTSGVPLVVNHNLSLVNKDAFTFNLMLAGMSVQASVTSVDVNTLSITTAIDTTGLALTIIGVIA